MHVNLYNMGVRMSTGGPIDMHVSLYNMGQRLENHVQFNWTVSN